MKKRLYRNTDEKVLAGVCAGLADYFDIDPVLVRVVWVLLAFSFGTGVLAYIICIFIIPKKKTYLK